MIKYFGRIEINLVVRIAHKVLCNIGFLILFSFLNPRDYITVSGQCKIVHTSNLVYTQLQHYAIELDIL